MQRLKRVMPTLVLAIGVCAATAIAIVTSTSLWLLPAGPLVLSLSILLARFLDRRWTAGNKGTWRQALSMSITCFVASLAVAYVGPQWVAQVIPVLGGASFTVLSEPLRCFRRGNTEARPA
jgi:hypothetical protein